MSENSRQSKIILSYCNECGQETKHDVVHEAKRIRTDDYGYCSVEVGSLWQMLQCRGCEEVTLRRADWCSEDDPGNGPQPIYFPPRVSRRKPAWWGKRYNAPPEYFVFSEEISTEGAAQARDKKTEYFGLLEEIYTALHADSRRLAMMGVRALIDVFIQHNVCDQGNFEKCLDALEEKHLLSKQDRGYVKAAVEAGHATAHRGYIAQIEEVNVAIDIVERLIHAEILAEQAEKLKKSTPVRPPRVAGKKT